MILNVFYPTLSLNKNTKKKQFFNKFKSKIMQENSKNYFIKKKPPLWSCNNTFFLTQTYPTHYWLIILWFNNWQCGNLPPPTLKNYYLQHLQALNSLKQRNILQKKKHYRFKLFDVLLNEHMSKSKKKLST